MFITSTGFKRLVNEAYKGAGLLVGNDGDGYYISGSYWVIWIRNGMIPKKELASIIELTGGLPEMGEAFRATKMGNQYEIPWREACDAMNNARSCNDAMEITPLILDQTWQQARILQNPDNGTIVLINERFVDMIDNTVIDYENGETQAEGPLISGKIQGVFWRNNIMALHVYPREDEGNRKLLGFLETFDIMDEGGEDGEHRLFGHGLPKAVKEKEEKKS